MHDLVIYGAGGLGGEVAEMIRRINARHRFWNFLGFIDDESRSDRVWQEYGVIGGQEFIANFSKPLDVVLAISAPQSKEALYNVLKKFSFIHFSVIIDIDTMLSSSVILNEGVVVSHFCSLSVGVSLGACTFLNTGTHVGHYTSLGNFCSVMPNSDISGDTHIGEGVVIGAGASIFPGKKIGSNSIVGMGSVVLNDVPANCTVLGNPARKFWMKRESR